MNQDIIDNCFNIIDKNLIELFTCISNKSQYHFFDFSIILQKIEDEIRYSDNVSKKTMERFKDYISYIDEVFNKPYSQIIFVNIVFDDEKQMRYTTTQRIYPNRDTTEQTSECSYNEISDIILDKQASSKIVQEKEPVLQSMFDTYSIELCTIYEEDFQDVRQKRALKYLKQDYCGETYFPLKTLNHFMYSLLKLNKILHKSQNSVPNCNVSLPQINTATEGSKVKGITRTQARIQKNLSDYKNKWIQVNDKDKFIQDNKHLLMEKIGKELYACVLALQKRKYLKNINRGEVCELFKLLQECFGAGGTRKAFQDAHTIFKTQGNQYISIMVIDKIYSEIK